MDYDTPGFQFTFNAMNIHFLQPGREIQEVRVQTLDWQLLAQQAA